MKRMLVMILGTTLLVAGACASAQDISYMWGELRYESFDLDGGGDLDGPALEFNFHLDDRFYIPGSVLSGDVDLGSNSSNRTFWDLGLGYHRPTSSANTDFIAELKYVDAANDDGVSLLGGFRSQLRDELEGKIALSVADIGGTVVALEGGFLFELWNEFGFTLDAKFDDDSNWGAGVGLRWSF